MIQNKISRKLHLGINLTVHLATWAGRRAWSPVSVYSASNITIMRVLYFDEMWPLVNNTNGMVWLFLLTL